MSETGTPARPRQLTMAGGFVIGGSVLLLLSIFDTMANLQSVEMRDEITKVIDSPTGQGLGISVSEALAAMRVGLMVAAACAAAAVVLGVYALQRHRAARLALGVLAVPILLTAPLTGGLIGAVVAAATLMLWSGPARDWYAGRPVRESGPASAAPRSRPRPPEQPTPPGPDHGHGREQYPAPPPGPPAAGDQSSTPRATSLTTAGSSTEPGTTAGFGQLPTALAAPSAGDRLPPPYAATPSDSEVPVTVKVACILTWVFSGVVAMLYAGMLLALLVAQDRIVDYVVTSPAWQRAGLERSTLVPILWVGCLVFLAWAVGALVLAWLTWRRHNWARWLLAGSAAATVVVAIFAFPIGVLHQLAAVLTIVGLFGTAARNWFAPRSWAPGGPPASGPPHSGPDSGSDSGSHFGPPGESEAGSPGPAQYPSADYPSADPTPGHDARPGGKPPVW